MPINVPWYLHLDLSKHVMRNISRFRLRAHTLKVEAAAWHEDGSCVCDQCPGEDEHVQNEVHALLFCQDHRVRELRKHFFFLFTPFYEDFSAAQPFLLQQVKNQLVHDFLSQQNNRPFLFLSELMDLFVAGRDQSAADQPNYLAEGHPHCNHCNHWWLWLVKCWLTGTIRNNLNQVPKFFCNSEQLSKQKTWDNKSSETHWK